MKKEKTIYSMTEKLEKKSVGDLEVIQTEPIELEFPKKLCNSCKNKLPDILDRGICPHCQKRTG